MSEVRTRFAPSPTGYLHLGGLDVYKRQIMRWGNDPIGPFCDQQLHADYDDHADAFTFEIVDTVDQEKCESRQDSLEALDALYEKICQRYADVPQWSASPSRNPARAETEGRGPRG